jgi:hypothetical protein
MANGNNKLCAWITCLGILASVGLLIWILVKQHDCKCGSKSKFRISTGGIGGSDNIGQGYEPYREYAGGFSGTNSNGYGWNM